MGLDVGDECWLVVRGDPDDGANCHKAEVVSVSPDGLAVKRVAWSDNNTLNKSGKPYQYKEIVVAGLRQD